MIRKTISGLIILIYIILGLLTDDLESALYIIMYCLLPFFAIWFPTEMGDFVGVRLGAPSITGQSPGCLIHFLGWIMLFIPIVVVSILMLTVE